MTSPKFLNNNAHSSETAQIWLVKKMKYKLRIFLTNWINVAGIFLAVYLATVVNELVNSRSIADMCATLYQAVSSGLIGLILYGSVFFIGFLLAMLLLDILLIGKDLKYLQLKLLIEWITVSSPLLYWYIIYTKWIFLVAISTFLITQLIRKRVIRKLTLAQ